MSTGAFLEFLTRLGCRDAGLGLVGQVSRAAHKNSAGSRPQGPVGQVSMRLGARAPRAWGPAHQGPGAFSPQKPPKPPHLRCFANLLVGAWRRRGCRLKRLLRRWGPGGKRSRDTPPTPYALGKGRGFSPSPPSATIQHAPQGRRIALNPKPETPNLKP